MSSPGEFALKVLLVRKIRLSDVETDFRWVEMRDACSHSRINDSGLLGDDAGTEKRYYNIET